MVPTTNDADKYFYERALISFLTFLPTVVAWLYPTMNGYKTKQASTGLKKRLMNRLTKNMQNSFEAVWDAT